MQPDRRPSLGPPPLCCTAASYRRCRLVHPPQATEGALAFWMDEMHLLLTYDNVALAEADADKEGVLDAVKCAVCQVSSG